MRAIHCTALFFFILSLSPVAFGQQACHEVIRGAVLDDQNAPLVGATVVVDGSNIIATTDDKGNFMLPGLCSGTYTIEISYVGYITVTKRVNTTEKKLFVTTLATSTTTLRDVTVEDTRQSQRLASQTISTLDKTMLAQLHGRPLGESLKEIPGVNAIQTGPAIFKPVIHGLHSQRILILNNGIRQEGQQWGAEHAPEVDPFIASSIEVVKGAETVRYGADAIGGVIIINPPPLHEVRALGGEMNLGFMSNNRMGIISGMLEGNFKPQSKWHWRLQSSAKRGGDYHTPNYNLSYTGTKEINASIAAGFQDDKKGLEFYGSSFNTEIGILRAAHSGNVDEFQASIDNQRPWFVRDFTYDINNPYQQIHHHLFKVKSFIHLNPQTKLNLLYGGQYNQRKEFDIRRAGRSSIPSMFMNLLSNVVDVSIDHEKGKHNGSIGVNGTYKYNKNATDVTGIIALIPDYEQVSGGLFILEKWRRSSWTFDAGARYDYQLLNVFTFQGNQLLKPSFNFHFFSGTAGVAYLFNSTTRIVANVGIGSRPPHVSELYSQGLHHSAGAIEEGLMQTDQGVSTDDDNIKKETSRKITTSLQINGSNVSMDLSLYYNDISNYVFLHPTGLRSTIQGFFPVFQYDQTHAVLTGSDLAIKWSLTKSLSYEGKFSYLYASDISNHSVLIAMPPAQIETLFTFQPAKSGSLRNLYFTVSAPYTFKQFRAPRVVYPKDVVNNTSDEIFDFAPAPNGYLLLNLRAGFSHPLFGRDLSVSLSAENVLDRSYRNYMNRWRYYAGETGRNFIIRLSYNFYKH